MTGETRQALRAHDKTLTSGAHTRCEEWYHLDCVRISEESVELVDLFICPKCASSTSQAMEARAGASNLTFDLRRFR